MFENALLGKSKCNLFNSFIKGQNLIRNYIFDSDLVWRIQLMIIKGEKFVLCV